MLSNNKKIWFINLYKQLPLKKKLSVYKLLPFLYCYLTYKRYKFNNLLSSFFRKD